MKLRYWKDGILLGKPKDLIIFMFLAGPFGAIWLIEIFFS